MWYGRPEEEVGPPIHQRLDSLGGLPTRQQFTLPSGSFTPPHEPTTTGLDEIATMQFLQLPPRARTNIRSHGEADVGPALRPLLTSTKACLGGVATSAWSHHPRRRFGLVADASSQECKSMEEREKRWEQWKNQTKQQSTALETLTFSHPFFFTDNVENPVYAGRCQGPPSQQIDNERLTKPINATLRVAIGAPLPIATLTVGSSIHLK